MSSASNSLKSINRDSLYYSKNIKNSRKKYLTTPFYTPLNSGNNINHRSNRAASFTPYDLFCLRTKIAGYISDLLDIKSLGVRYDSIVDDGLEIVIIVPILEGLDLNLDKISNENIINIQNRINYEVSANPNYCLAFQTSHLYLSHNSTHIPTSWIMHMVPLLDIPDEYYGTYEIDELTSVGYLYLNLFDQINYNDLYQDLIISLSNQLVKMYEDGYILGADDIADDWGLEMVNSLDDSGEISLGVYKPTWNNSRLCTDRVSFLQKLIHNPKTIELTLSSGCNQVTRYFVSREMSILSKYITFDSNTVFIHPIENLEEAEQIVSTIEELTLQNAKVVFLRNSSKEIAYYYANLMENILPYHSKYPPIVYTDNDLEISYVTVGLINNLQDPEIIQNQIRFMAKQS